jgi:hypothetical protein
MFNLDQSQTVWVPVESEFSGENGRRTIKFEVKCKRLGQEFVDELREQMKTGETDDPAIARQVIVDWRGIGGDDGPAPFTPENLDSLINLGLATPIVFAYLATFPKAKLKN